MDNAVDPPPPFGPDKAGNVITDPDDILLLLDIAAEDR
jgi:hypothetical protein